MLEYNWTRLLNKCMYAVTIYFCTFPVSKELYIFLLKKRRPRLFKLYQAQTMILTCKNSSRRWCLLGLGPFKNLTFSYIRADFSVIVNISVKTLWCLAIDSIFAFFIFCISFKSCFLFLAWHDQYFIMLKDSNVFKFTMFHSKHSIIILYLFCQ